LAPHASSAFPSLPTPIGRSPVIRDKVLDEARAVAIGWHHEQVEPRHVLYGLVRALGSDARRSAPLARVKLLMAPAGTATGHPAASPEAQTILDGITDQATAKSAADDLATRLLSDLPEFATTGGTPAVSSTVEPSGDTTQSVLAELDGLVGLGVVKASVRRLIAVQSLNSERRAAGLPEVNASHHLVFTGNPGTGKTTVARLVARLYRTIGILSKGQLVEATRADLIAGYVGQTAIKVQEVVRKAIGGILFIDEAYALAPEGPWDYGNEAIATLVQMMEEHRRDLAVIAAGYPDEMKRFIDSNPGLRSRFTTYIDFPDYNVDELVQIFEAIAAQAKVNLGPGVTDAVRHLCADKVDDVNFGNGRYTRSLFEDGYANMAARAYADGKIGRDEMETMLVDDIPRQSQSAFTAHHHLGFRAPGDAGTTAANG
jgi:stage V sporulation protein K